MMRFIKTALKKSWLLALVADLVLFPLSIIVLLWLRIAKFIGLNRMYFSRFAVLSSGVFPIVNHYYEPAYHKNQLSKPLHSTRNLPGIDFNEDSQIQLLKMFDFQDELAAIPTTKSGSKQPFYFQNGSYETGDAELYYSIIRHFQPKNILEIGSGFSTLIALEATKKNKQACKIQCIEPFEMNWLENLGVSVTRDLVEHQPIDKFLTLEDNDILFIDSSHVIRPQGDVIFEILEILPKLNKGVLVHFHDIFTPNDYPDKWLSKDFRLWNEQYLLEAFLSNNNAFEVICSLNHLCHTRPQLVKSAFPVYAQHHNLNPGAFWIKKVN